MNISSKLTVAKNVVTSKAGRQVLRVQKNSPTILFASGVVGVVATTVLASRATLKLEETLEKHEENRYTAQELYTSGHQNYSKQDYTRDVAIIRVRAALSVAKLYAPAFTVGAVSVCALGGSHLILTRRNASLTAAYVAVDKAFAEYRQRVEKELGTEKERELRYDVTEERVDDTKGGKVQTVKTPHGKSIYARFFDESNRNWNKESMYNQVFLQCQQNYANDLLRSRGHVFLNDVYDMLGMERSKEGAVVGWVLGGGGDDYIDFGVFEGDRFMGFEFVKGNERSVLLDFNVDGVVYDKI